MIYASKQLCRRNNMKEWYRLETTPYPKPAGDQTGSPDLLFAITKIIVRLNAYDIGSTAVFTLIQ